MIENLHRYIRPYSPRSLPHYRQHIDSLRLYTKEHVRRYLEAPGYEAPGMKLLRHILGLIDYKIIHKFPNDYDKYMNYMRYIKDVLNGVFDPVRTGRCYYNHFFSDENIAKVSEYLCPVYDNDHLKILPFNEPFTAWTKLQPVTMWYNDANELTQYFLGNQFKYHYVPPTYGIIYIDPIMLGMMYVKYLSENNYTDDNVHVLQREFIRKHIFVHFFNQAMDSWLLNQMNRLLICNSMDEVEVLHGESLATMNNRYGYIGARHLEGTTELYQELLLVKKGNTPISSLLSSKLFLNDTFFDKIEYLKIYGGIPHLRQYKYMEIMSELPYLTLLVNFYTHTPDASESTAMIRDLRYYCRLLIGENIYNSVKNAAVREQFKAELHEFMSLLLSFNV